MRPPPRFGARDWRRFVKANTRRAPERAHLRLALAAALRYGRRLFDAKPADPSRSYHCPHTGWHGMYWDREGWPLWLCDACAYEARHRDLLLPATTIRVH